MQVNYLVTKHQIHLSFNGTHQVIGRDHKLYDAVRLAIKEGRANDIPDILIAKGSKIEEYIEGSGLTLEGGILKDSDGDTLPQVLSDRLIELHEDDMPVSSLVNFWNNLKQNPSMRSREQLYQFLEQKGHPITEDGCFIAYRGVTGDFKDCHTRTFDNSPGAVCEMKRENVDDDPTRTCSRGLHVAAFQYAKDFGERTVEVKVNPRDVVAVPVDYNGQKMRVCRFEVIQEVDSMRTGPAKSAIDWDAPDEYDEGFVEEVLLYASVYKNRYTDRSSLAVRIDEEIDAGNWDYAVADVLQVLNDNEGRW